MDSSANTHHGLHTVYSAADAMGDMPETIRSNVSQAEALAVVQHLLGLRTTQISGPRIAVLRRIEDRVFDLVDETRSSVTRVALRETLDSNLDRAMRQIRPELDYASATERERTQAIAQAVYESLPSDVTFQMAVRSAPVNFSIVDGEPSSMVTLPVAIGPATEVRIDMNHTFWREADFSDNAALAAAMTGRLGNEIGIRNANLRLFPIAPGDAFVLAAANFNAISVSPVNIAPQQESGLTLTAVGGRPARTIDLSIRLNDLSRGVTTADAPAGLQNRQIADLTSDQIMLLLRHRGARGDFPYWRLYVQPGTPLPDDPEAVITASVSGRFVANQRLYDVAQALVESATGGGTQALGVRSFNLLKAHTEVRSEHERLQGIMTRLTTGSENEVGAAVALNLAASNRAVMESATRQAEEARVRTDINRSRAQLELSKQLRQLGELKLNLRIANMPGGAAATYDRIITERNNIRLDMSVVGSGTAWASEFCTTSAFPAPTAANYPTAALRNDMIARMQPQLKEVSDEIARYEEVEQLLRRIAQSAVTSETYAASPRLSELISAAGVVNRANVNATFNNVAEAETMRNQVRLDSESDIEASIKTNEELLKKAKTGGASGDALQQKIFEEHFKRQGLSAAESQKAGNYLYSRSLMDGELQAQQETLIQDMFADHTEDGVSASLEYAYKERRPNKVILRLLNILHVPTVDRLNNDEGIGPEWRSASYPTLITAYFTLKKLYEGGGSAYVNCVGSELVKRNMRRIARILARIHVNMLVTDFGNDLSEEDRKKIASRKALSLETLEKILLGEAPAKYGPRVSQMLGLLDERVDSKRRKLGRAVAKTGHVSWTAAKWSGEKAKNSVKSGVKRTWGQRRNIAAFAACSALGGPLGALGWVAWKALKSNTSSSGQSSHSH